MKRTASDTSAEIEDLQLRIMTALTPDQRISYGCQMFMAARRHILDSLPPDLSPSEVLKRFHQIMYGQKLPADFFSNGKL